MPSYRTPERGSVEADLCWRQAVMAGDEQAWHQFVHRYSDLAVETAVRWCDLHCRHPGGCSLKRGPGGPFNRFLQGDCRCDRVGTAYCFILEKLREKIVFYRGDRGCRLDTWVRHILVPQARPAGAAAGCDYGYRQLYADYVRKVEGRIRAPAEILRRDTILEQVYLLYHYGRDEAEICDTLHLSSAQLDQAVQRIEEALRRKGSEFFWRFWAHLWVPREVESLSPQAADEAAEFTDPPAAGPDAHTSWEAHAVEQALADAIDALPPLIRHVLWLSFDEGLAAAEIAADLRSNDLASWTPRQVYSEIDRALTQICRSVSQSLAPVDEVAVNPRRMKGVLEFWSVQRFLERKKDRHKIPNIRV
jgi:DNA-directed RNA polymerase specialized sigma24 family protein